MKRLLLCFLAVTLTSCQDPKIPIPLPEGEQTIQGILHPAELSIVRRGTHVLVIDGTEQYFVESAVVNLRGYELKLVTLRGFLEPNLDLDAYPLLVVNSVVDVESTSREWYVGFLDLSITTPLSWTQSIASGTVHFFIKEFSNNPVLTLSQEAGTVLPVGTSIVVDGLPAVRITDERMGSQTITVRRDDKLLTILFSPREGMDIVKVKTDWIAVLQSIDLTESSRSSSPSTSSGAVIGKPCGGSAGILCAVGFFCQITDLKENIGMCMKL
ncbi:MAG: hypothetical protein O2904_00520 [bacterium]|nr:hypothetical protein [bacterium]